MGREAKRQLASRRVAHDNDFLCVQVIRCGTLNKEMICGTDIGKRARPTPTFIAHAAIFEVRRRQAFCGQSAAEMSRVIEVVLGAPVAPMDVDDEWKRRLTFCFGSGSRRSRNWFGSEPYAMRASAGGGGTVRMSSDMPQRLYGRPGAGSPFCLHSPTIRSEELQWDRDWPRAALEPFR